jgi:hypothetical protein
MSRFHIVVFIILMVICGIGKCYTDAKKIRNKIFTTALTVFGIITGGAVLFQMLPTPATPQINEIIFIANGNPYKFSFYCKFFGRNDGQTICYLEKVEFLIPDTRFEFKNTAILTTGFSGGSGGRLGGPEKAKSYIACSTFPQSLPSSNQLFQLIGEGENPNSKAGSFDSSSNIEINFHFQSKNGLKVIHKTVPILTGQEIAIRN